MVGVKSDGVNRVKVASDQLQTRLEQTRLARLASARLAAFRGQATMNDRNQPESHARPSRLGDQSVADLAETAAEPYEPAANSPVLRVGNVGPRSQ